MTRLPRHHLLLATCALVVVLAGACAGRRPSSGAGSTGGNGAAATAQPAAIPQRPVISVRSFDDLMDVREDWIDVGLGNFLMAYEAGHATEDDVRMARQQLDRIIQAAAGRIERVPAGVEVSEARQRQLDRHNADAIVGLIVELGFRYDRSDPEGHKPENLFLHQVLRRQKGYCVSLSMLALSIATALDVPLHGVRVPGHMFVRYGDHANIDGDGRNYEMTDDGSERANHYYSDKYHVVPQSVANRAFLVNLDSREIFSDACSNLGSLYYLRENWTEAIRWYRRAIDLDPDNPQAHYNLATTFTKAGDVAEAIRHFRNAIEINPGDYFSLCGRAKLYFELGDPEVGLEDLGQALKLRKDEPYAFVLRGVFAAKQGDTAAAERDFRKALSLDPDDVGANRNIALLYANTQRTDEAREYIERFLELAPDDPDAHRFRAWLASLDNDG